MRRRRVDAHHRKLAGSGASRQENQVSGGKQHTLSPDEPAGRERYPSADSQISYLPADFEHASNAFIANHRGQSRPKWVESSCDKNVAEINGREFDADQHLADAGLFGPWHVSIFEARSRIAIGREHDCFHDPFLSRLVLGNVLPNIGRPLFDDSRVASSWITSQCSTRTPSLMRTMSATIQFAGWPTSENRPCSIRRFPSAKIAPFSYFIVTGECLTKLKRPSRPGGMCALC